uniref:Uncharacterized protein n=1 Tax=Ditylenchus dipsaci TaxID=166011 RepID=A0A915CY64_9BILA
MVRTSLPLLASTKWMTVLIVDVGKIVDSGVFLGKTHNTFSRTLLPPYFWTPDFSDIDYSNAKSFDFESCKFMDSVGIYLCNGMDQQTECSILQKYNCAKEILTGTITKLEPFANGFIVATNEFTSMYHSNKTHQNETIALPSNGIFFIKPDRHSLYVIGNTTLRPIPFAKIRLEHVEDPKLILDESIFQELDLAKEMLDVLQEQNYKNSNVSTSINVNATNNVSLAFEIPWQAVIAIVASVIIVFFFVVVFVVWPKKYILG